VNYIEVKPTVNRWCAFLRRWRAVSTA